MKNIVPVYPYVLYGDDHALDRALFTQLMERADPNIQVLPIENGWEIFQFLEQLQQEAVLPGCIVLDMDMPIWDGMRVLKVIKEHNQYHPIPCVLLSNSNSERDKKLAESLGAEAFISKSYDLDQQKSFSEQVAAYCKKPAMTKSQF
jgi:CheY-like chemotaxis protein